jgi:biopolymer transport protein ExbD
VAIHFNCPQCGTEHDVADSLGGRRVRCPGCDQLVEVPKPALAAPLPSAAHTTASRADDKSRFRGASSEPAPPPEPIDLGTGGRIIDNEIDMTPMVDVVFQLLIFFMLTAVFTMQKSIEIPKPEQTDQPSTMVLNVEDNPDYVTIVVDENGTFQVITPDWERECPGEQDLHVQLREAKRGSGGVTPTKVLVKAHGNAYHERVVMALDGSTAVGFEETQLMTYEEEG